MLPSEFAALSISRYELRLRACEAIALPAFLGSTLRGAFGHALKNAICVMNHRDCERCMLSERCIYPYLFETPAPSGLRLLRGQKQAPHPFIISPPPATVRKKTTLEDSALSRDQVSAFQLSDGASVRLVRPSAVIKSDMRRHLRPNDELTFGLLLMGRAIDYLPYIVYAVSEMARRGLGADRGRFELFDVALIDHKGMSRSIYSSRSARIASHNSAPSNLSEYIAIRIKQLAIKNSLKLRFLTPTRIRVDGDLQPNMSFELLVRNLLRRISLLTAVHGRAPLELDYPGLIARAAEVSAQEMSLSWWDWERYSNRQKTKMMLGGFIGEVEYAGQRIDEFMPLLIAGEILCIGAGTSFGLGSYEIVV